jgi:uncharacterized protein (TIGR03663 family)
MAADGDDRPDRSAASAPQDDDSEPSDDAIVAGLDRLTLAVVGVVAAALAARLIFLGARVAHWDEGRVAYWVLDYLRYGDLIYRPIIHGPLYHHVNRPVFAVLGANDFTMRLFPAIVGGLLPGAALLFREHLDDIETALLAVFLAFNPVLLYYSRFMRGDILVAAFMFTAFGCLVRTIDTGRNRYLVAAGALVALGFSAKENALIYLLTWVGATALLLDIRLLTARFREEKPLAVLKRYLGWGYRGLRIRLAALGATVATFLVVLVYMYAPRGTTDNLPINTTERYNGTGFNEALTDPSALPDVVWAALYDSGQAMFGQWIGGGSADHPYLPYLGDHVQTLVEGALVVCLFAVFGFLVNRYRGVDRTDLVSFAFYCGFVSVLGYPIITDIKAPWATVHPVIMLTIPAAVGVALVIRWGRDAFASEDAVGMALSAVVVFLAVGIVASSALSGVYLQPQAEDNKLVQYAQPADDIHPEMAVLDTIAEDNEGGPDLLLYGEYFVDGASESSFEPACARWFNALPLPWYISASEANVTCAQDDRALDALGDDKPPMVIVRSDARAAVERNFPEYVRTEKRLRVYGTETSFYVAPEYADQLE